MEHAKLKQSAMVPYYRIGSQFGFDVRDESVRSNSDSYIHVRSNSGSYMPYVVYVATDLDRPLRKLQRSMGNESREFEFQYEDFKLKGLPRNKGSTVHI
jgi:hypothetical protein